MTGRNPRNRWTDCSGTGGRNGPESVDGFGRNTHPNAVRTHIWIAISVYVLVAIVRKRLGIQRDLYTLLQILSVCPFEQVSLPQVLAAPGYTATEADIRNQWQLFDL